MELAFEDGFGLGFGEPSFCEPIGDELLQLFRTAEFEMELEPLAQLHQAISPASPTTSASDASQSLAATSCTPAPPPVMLVKQAAARGPLTRRTPALPPAPVQAPNDSAVAWPAVTTSPPPPPPGLAGSKLCSLKQQSEGSACKAAASPSPSPSSTGLQPTSNPSPSMVATSAPTMLPKPSVACTVAAKPVTKAPVVVAPISSSATKHDDMDTDSEDSNDTEEDAMRVDENGQKINKRKAPEVDWRSIEDPAERRRQRRLAKNRVTAARSRERKKAQWSDMEGKLAALEADNSQLRAMLEAMTRENGTLREQLDQLVGGRSGAPVTLGGSSNNEPAALVFIAIMLLLVASLPGDQASAAALALASSVPLLLAALQQLQQASAQRAASSGAERPRSGKRARKAQHQQQPPASCLHPSSGGYHLWASLVQFLAAVSTLLARGRKRLAKSVQRMLYGRHHFMPRAAFRAAAPASMSAAASAWPSLVAIKPELLASC